MGSDSRKDGEGEGLELGPETIEEGSVSTGVADTVRAAAPLRSGIARVAPLCHLHVYTC